MSLKSQAVSGVKWNGLATSIKIAIQFFSVAVLAHLLAPGDFGLVSMAVVATGFIQAFADLGLSNAIIHRQDATREQLSSLYWLNLGAGFVLFILLWLVAPLVAAYFREPAVSNILRWSALSFLIAPFGQQWQILLRREMRFKALSLIEVIEGIGYAAFAIGLALAGFGVMSLVWAGLARTLIKAGLLAVIAVRRHWLPMPHFSCLDLKGFVGFGLFQMGERAMNFLATNVDYLIIGRFLGPKALGYYTLAYNLMRMPLIYINPVVVSVAFPAFSRVQHQDDLLRRGYSKVLQYLGGVTFPIMAGMFVVAPIFVPLVYGEPWLPTVPVIQVFCLLGASKSLGNPLGSILMAKGRADLGFYLNVLAVFGYAISNFIGVQWGIVGVAVSTVAFAFLVLKPLDFYLRWLTIRMTIREFWLAIRFPFYAAMAMLVLIYGLRHLLPLADQLLTFMAVLIVAGVAAYGGTLWLLDRSFIIEAWQYLGLGRLRRK